MLSKEDLTTLWNKLGEVPGGVKKVYELAECSHTSVYNTFKTHLHKPNDKIVNAAIKVIEDHKEATEELSKKISEL